MTNRMRCLSSVSLPSPASMLAWDAATYDSGLLDATADRFDRRLRARGHADALELDRALDLALLDDLRLHRARGHEAGRLQRSEVDRVALDRVELVEQHFGRVARHLRAKTDLRQAAL